MAAWFSEGMAVTAGMPSEVCALGRFAHGKLQQTRALSKDLARRPAVPTSSHTKHQIILSATPCYLQLRRAGHAAATRRSKRTSPSDSAAASTGPALSATPGRQHTAVTNSPAALPRPADTERTASGVAQLVW